MISVWNFAVPSLCPIKSNLLSYQRIPDNQSNIRVTPALRENRQPLFVGLVSFGAFLEYRRIFPARFGVEHPLVGNEVLAFGHMLGKHELSIGQDAFDNIAVQPLLVPVAFVYFATVQVLDTPGFSLLDMVNLGCEISVALDIR